MITVGENTRVAPEEARNYHVSVSIAVANLDNRRRPGHSTVVMSGGSDGRYSATLLFNRGWRLVGTSFLSGDQSAYSRRKRPSPDFLQWPDWFLIVHWWLVFILRPKAAICFLYWSLTVSQTGLLVSPLLLTWPLTYLLWFLQLLSFPKMICKSFCLISWTNIVLASIQTTPSHYFQSLRVPANQLRIFCSVSPNKNRFN